MTQKPKETWQSTCGGPYSISEIKPNSMSEIKPISMSEIIPISMSEIKPISRKDARKLTHFNFLFFLTSMLFLYLLR